MKNYSEIWNQPRKLKSDKWEHYFDIYDHCLSRFYDKKISFLEIGIQNGGSIEVAQKLFDSIIAIREKQKLEPLRIQK